MFGYYWDPTYSLVLIGAILCMIASLNVNQTFKKYSQYANSRYLSAEECARIILQASGIYDVRIERVRGTLTDHYSPHEKVLRLSESVYGNTSIAALGVAAHECGHAIQHQVGYAPLKLRSLSVPLANVGSMLSWPIIVLGIMMGSAGLARIGVILFVFVVLFQLITLPVEFNASARALKVLQSQQLLSGQELSGARKVLSAAALTYVAALISTILQLFRLILLTRSQEEE